MATKVADRALLDTNVLLAATDEGRSEHAKSLAALERWPALGTALYTSGQVLREYLVVSTRPVDLNGLGLDRRDALLNARTFRGRLRLLEETSKTLDTLFELLGEIDCSGKQIHDANLVATALAHGIEAIVTLNVDDLSRFEARVRVIDLAST
jgi:predicted nucleic acid-binding protein